jgi:hypothetical protein
LARVESFFAATVIAAAIPLEKTTLAKKTTWPKINFREKGPKVPAGGFQKLGFGWELHYYDFLRRWNGGVPSPDCFKVENWDDEYTVARVKYFHGIYDESADYRDLRHAVYHTWDYLPRGTIPIAAVEIEDSDWDLCILITFAWTERCNKIYLLANPHDCGPYDPDDLSRLQPIASTLPQFMKLLQPFDELKYRTWFGLDIPANDLQRVVESLNENGFDDFGQYTDAKSLRSVEFHHDDMNFTVWLASSHSKIFGVGLPNEIPNESFILAIDAFAWNQAKASNNLRSMLKPLKLDRRLRKLGKTSIK